jgi:hypothetical protein
MHKLIYANKDEGPPATSELHSNAFPEGWREIPVGEFARSNFFTYSPTFVEYRQMYPTDDDGIIQHQTKMTAAKLFHYNDGTGIAMSSDFWGKKIYYYKFGCDHKYKEMGMNEAKERGFQHHGMCWHVYECVTCGDVMSTDSSD